MWKSFWGYARDGEWNVFVCTLQANHSSHSLSWISISFVLLTIHLSNNTYMYAHTDYERNISADVLHLFLVFCCTFVSRKRVARARVCSLCPERTFSANIRHRSDSTTTPSRLTHTHMHAHPHEYRHACMCALQKGESVV